MNRKRIALIAHDYKKEELITWALEHRDILAKHHLCGTGTTSGLVSERTGLTVKGFLSGPHGGDQQIGAAIAQDEVDMLIFFWDPLTSQPHDPDVKALLRMAVLKNIPTASNVASANLIIKEC
ncbi:MAG: methylglyoxal synthase [Erysipelothrix sp.]|jgi:methylglyoxal synthase|nr:methylglyoxal synthase [Erysipelothrix sp.]